MLYLDQYQGFAHIYSSQMQLANNPEFWTHSMVGAVSISTGWNKTTHFDGNSNAVNGTMQAAN